VMCGVAADRGARLARLREDDATAERWQKAADEIKADVLTNGLDERGVVTQHYDTNSLAASLLLMPLVRFLPPDDEHVRRTVLAIADELTVDGLVLRYKVEETDDGLSGEEGTFTICSFWLVSALVEIGELGRARQLCEKLLAYASPLGLFGEELDPRTGRHLGNFPQAFTHLALINAVVHVIDAERHNSAAATPLPEPERPAAQSRGAPPSPGRIPDSVWRQSVPPCGGAPKAARRHAHPHRVAATPRVRRRVVFRRARAKRRDHRGRGDRRVAWRGPPLRLRAGARCGGRNQAGSSNRGP